MIKYEGLEFSEIHLGEDSIDEIYLGDILIWETSAGTACFSMGYWNDNLPWVDTEYWND